MHPSILTFSGKYINFLDPSVNDYDIVDIAEGLGKICRFTGHSRVFYSVAQHSVLCSYNVPKEYALEALLHDATEAYLGDVSSPLKSILPDYVRLEEMHYAAISKKFGIPEQVSDVVKYVDLVLLKTEKRDLMLRGDNSPFWAFLEVVDVLKAKIYPVSPEESTHLFLKRFYELTKK